MSEQSENETRHEGTRFEGGSEAPAPVLREYPPEAAPGADDDTPPVMVPGEQTSPERRLDVFPEDERTASRDRSDEGDAGAEPPG